MKWFARGVYTLGLSGWRLVTHSLFLQQSAATNYDAPPFVAAASVGTAPARFGDSILDAAVRVDQQKLFSPIY